MKAALAFGWVAAFTVLALFSSLDARLCRGFVVAMAAWAVLGAIRRPTPGRREFFLTAAALAASYALLLALAWAGGVEPDWAYLNSVGPYLLAGMFAPAACLGAAGEPRGRMKWAWLGLWAAAGLLIEANNLGWIDYRRIQPGFVWVGWNEWTEKFYIYWLLLLVWPGVALLSWRRPADRRVILGLLAFTAVLIWASGRSVRALGILACGVAVYGLLTKFSFTRRQLQVAVLAVVLGWVAAPWLWNVVDLSRLDPRIKERTRIYQATHELVDRQPWLGYGFGRARELTHPLLPWRFQRHLPGGHPHNLGLLFWLEYGLAGAVWLGGVTWWLLRRVVDVAAGTEGWPALAALIASFVAMVSFSWDIWEFPVIGFYALAAGLVVALLGRGPGLVESGDAARRRAA